MKLKCLFSTVIVVLALPVFGQLTPMTYQQAQQVVANPPSAISQSLAATPAIYSFLNKEGVESVNYTGQTFRQVLISDIKPIAYSLQRGEFPGQSQIPYQILDSVYSYDVNRTPVDDRAINGRSRHLVSIKTDVAGASIFEGSFYQSIFPRTTNLQAKTAGVDNPQLNPEILGYNAAAIGGVVIDANGDGKKSPEEFVRAIMQAIAANAAGSESQFLVENPGHESQVITQAAITAEGLDLAQLLQKSLDSIISFNQATADYLSVDLGADKGLAADNEAPLPNRPFTTLEHHWDEAFGYFGAARDYLSYSDKDISDNFSIDSFRGSKYDPSRGDRFISLEREKNFALAVYAGRWDMRAATGDVDFSAKIFEAFLKGRQLISTKPADYRRYAQAYGVIAAVEWERVFAVNVIHYLNKLLADYDKYGTQAYEFQRLAVHFSEMKGFALAFQFSPVSLMSVEQFQELHTLLADKPTLPGSGEVANYKANLLSARELLMNVYDFAPVNVENW